MSFVYVFLLGALFYCSFGTITVTRQPPYQGVYLYQGVAAGLKGVTCPHLADPSNVTLQTIGQVGSTTCNYQGTNVPLTFVKKEDGTEPRTNSTNARYYLLSSNTTLTSGPLGWNSGNVDVLCWNGTDWETRYGWINEDKKKICCDNMEADDSCSGIIFLDEELVLEEQQETLDVGYGFQINYTTTVWPREELRTQLTCGNYTCSFNGTRKEYGDCTLDLDSITSKLPFIQYFAPIQSRPKHQYLHELNITVPFLTKDFEGVNYCEVRLLLGGVDQELARSVLPLNLAVTPPVVSSHSDIGLLDVADFQYKDPQCIGDGWPQTDGSWWYVRKQGKTKEISFSSNQKVAGKEFHCKVSQNNSTEMKHMMFISVPETNTLSPDMMKMIGHTASESIMCKIDMTEWSLNATSLGWTFPNGTEDSSTPSEHGKEIWHIPMKDEGIYKCWAETGKKWAEPDQQDTFRLSKNIRVELRPLTAGSKPQTTIPDSTTIPAGITIHSPINKTAAKGPETPTVPFSSYWYLIGLGVLTVFLVASTTFIYKIVKKNQAKVSNLDTKLALDTVRTKMGVNTLYSTIPLEEEEPMLARIPRINKEDLVTDRVLGAGQFGKVLKGRLTVTDEDGVPGEIDVAVKCLMHPEDDNSSEDFLKEVVMMYQLDHPNVVKLLGICTEYEQYMILSEFMENGNLRDFLMNGEPVLSLTDKLYICYQVVCGLEHMVSRNIVHRDIAARNCLVGPNMVVKVADFGLSRSMSMSNYYKKVGGQVPIRWMSPESLKYGKYTPESDVWAFGVLMWEVYTEGHFPYSGYSNEEVQGMLDSGFKLHVPPHCTEDVSVLMQATWETDPADRPTFKAMRTRLNQMLRNSGMSNVGIYSSASPDSQPSTSAQGAHDAALQDSVLMPDSNVRSPPYPRDTMTRGVFLNGEGSSRTTCCMGEESSSGTITNNEISTNRYVSEPGIVTVETAL